MKKPILAILAAILASLSCGQYVTPVPAVSPTIPTPTSSPPPSATVEPTATATEAAAEGQTAIVRQYSVYVHAEPSVESAEVGWVYADDKVTVLECQEGGDWCKIEQPFGWVYRGCLGGFEEGRGCREAQ